ncbi:MAG: hypothetical protein KJN94_07140, partial [Gammaproteobacteria bacterium]|nr:hypothetical protein [Gammaproteobacteria bacterium]
TGLMRGQRPPILAFSNSNRQWGFLLFLVGFRLKSGVNAGGCCAGDRLGAPGAMGKLPSRTFELSGTVEQRTGMS